MNEDFVTYELAVKLKEKGYPQHITDDAYITDNYGEDEYDIGDRLPIPLIPDYMDDVAAPTISQVLKWLREEKKIYIVIAVNPTLSTKDKIAYYYQVYSNSNGVTSDYYESEECYAQWEDCAIDSIKYVLDNLI